MNVIRYAVVITQAVAIASIVVGLWFLLCIGWFLVTAGLFVGIVSVATEFVIRKNEVR